MPKSKTSKTRTAKKAPATASGKKPPLDKQPQSKQRAALQVHLFLQTDDSWSNRYFDSGDLHNLDRELFG